MKRILFILIAVSLLAGCFRPSPPSIMPGELVSNAPYELFRYTDHSNGVVCYYSASKLACVVVVLE